MPFKAAHALELLAKAKAGSRLGHAYLISGPKEANREGFACQLLSLAAGVRRDSLEDWQQHGVHLERP